MYSVFDTPFLFLIYIWVGLGVLTLIAMVSRRRDRSGESWLEHDWSSPNGTGGGWRLSPTFSLFCQALVYLSLAIATFLVASATGGAA